MTPQVQVAVCPRVRNSDTVPVPVQPMTVTPRSIPVPVLHPNCSCWLGVRGCRPCPRPSGCRGYGDGDGGREVMSLVTQCDLRKEIEKNSQKIVNNN